MKHALFMSCCLVLAVVPLVFVAHRVYKDGVFGRAGLLGISFSAWTFILESVFSEIEYEVLSQTLMLVMSFTVFLCWHLFRFHSRVVLARRAVSGELERRGYPDAATNG